MEKYKKLIEKQRELINLLDESVEDMIQLDYETRERLFGEINNLEKEIEEEEKPITEIVLDSKGGFSADDKDCGDCIYFFNHYSPCVECENFNLYEKRK